MRDPFEGWPRRDVGRKWAGFMRPSLAPTYGGHLRRNYRLLGPRSAGEGVLLRDRFCKFAPRVVCRTRPKLAFLWNGAPELGEPRYPIGAMSTSGARQSLAMWSLLPPRSGKRHQRQRSAVSALEPRPDPRLTRRRFCPVCARQPSCTHRTLGGRTPIEASCLRLVTRTSHHPPLLGCDAEL